MSLRYSVANSIDRQLTAFERQVAQRQGRTVTLMDGSMGEELADRGFSTRDGLWSARALIDHPNEIVALHQEYLSAGAEVITTNTYSTVPSYLAKAGLGDRVRELATSAAELARKALDEFDKPNGARVAGCLPPLDESYRPDLVPAAHEAIPIYRDLIDSMAPSVDLFLAETMSSIDEAQHVAEALRSSPDFAAFEWMVSFTLDDRDGTKLRSGESVTEAVKALSVQKPIAILFNCTTPQSILDGVGCAHKVTTCRVGGYPNRFKPVPEDWTLDDDQEIMRDAGLTRDKFVSWSNRFLDAGASYLGGCCGIGPSYIEALARNLHARSS